jgi:hypothetical protein
VADLGALAGVVVGESVKPLWPRSNSVALLYVTKTYRLRSPSDVNETALLKGYVRHAESVRFVVSSATTFPAPIPLFVYRESATSTSVILAFADAE